MEHKPNSMVKFEIDCKNISLVNPLQTSMISTVTNNNINSNNNNNLTNKSAINSKTNTNINNSGTTTTGNTKMGSRRIFTPQFKLQVLDSYRNDSDCKGNQRATARKYGIHRRQIQKWLQCEQSLRAAVANLQQNNMKHQFHNVSHHQQHQIPIVSSASMQHNSNNNNINNITNNNINNNNSQQYKVNVMSLDTSRHAVGPATRPTTIQIPVPVTPTTTISLASNRLTTMATTKIHQSNNNSNITGATAMASISTTTLSSSSPSTALLMNSPTHTITAKIQAPPYNNNMPNFISDIQQQQQHQQQTHTPVLSSVPRINHYPHQQHNHHHQPYSHIINEHNHQQQQPIPSQNQYQYHQHHYQQHHQQQLDQLQAHQHHENFLLMPSASLPMPIKTNCSPVLISPTTAITIRNIDELRDVQHSMAMTGNCSVKDEYKNPQQYQFKEGFHYYTTTTTPYPTEIAKTTSTSPIDLSLGPRHVVYQEEEEEINSQQNTEQYVNTNKLMPLENVVQTLNVWPEIETNNNDNKNNSNRNIFIKSEPQDIQMQVQQSDYQAIDLTCRKRKNFNDSNATAEKVPKTSANHDEKSRTDQNSKESKPPVKLFKPYLLDDKDDNDNSKNINNNNKISDNQKMIKSENQDPIIWSHHPDCATSSYDNQSNVKSSSFHSNDSGYTFPDGNTTFQTTEYNNNNSFRITAPATPSPRSFSSRTTPSGSILYSPKGSPVSGYESASSSTFSDSGDYIYRGQHYHHHHHQQQQQQQPQYTTLSSQHQTYSLDLKMQTIIDNTYYYDNINCRDDQLTPNHLHHHDRNHVQRWLDQESDVKQGTVVYA